MLTLGCSVVSSLSCGYELFVSVNFRFSKTFPFIQFIHCGTTSKVQYNRMHIN